MAVPAPQALQQARLARALPKLRADETRREGTSSGRPKERTSQAYVDAGRADPGGPVTANGPLAKLEAPCWRCDRWLLAMLGGVSRRRM